MSVFCPCSHQPLPPGATHCPRHAEVRWAQPRLTREAEGFQSAQTAAHLASAGVYWHNIRMRQIEQKSLFRDKAWRIGCCKQHSCGAELWWVGGRGVEPMWAVMKPKNLGKYSLVGPAPLQATCPQITPYPPVWTKPCSPAELSTEVQQCLQPLQPLRHGLLSRVQEISPVGQLSITEPCRNPNVKQEPSRGRHLKRHLTQAPIFTTSFPPESVKRENIRSTPVSLSWRKLAPMNLLSGWQPHKTVTHTHSSLLNCSKYKFERTWPLSTRSVLVAFPGWAGWILNLQSTFNISEL